MGLERITTIGFDADDTLWHCEPAFQLTQKRFAAMLAPYDGGGELAERVLETTKANLSFYGFGVKSFTLSLIETALAVTDGRVDTGTLARIVAMGRAMLEEPVDTLPGVREALESLKSEFRFVLITKGDLLDQERKLAGSGLGDLFEAVEIVSRKDAETYRRAFHRHGDGADRALMVGNSLPSDVLPALDAGAWGVHVPYAVTWALERAEAPDNHPRFRVIDSLERLPALVRALNGDEGGDVTLG